MHVHVDTDFGGDPDDACALAMLCGWPGVEVVGVTTNLDGDGERAACARYLLRLAGCGSVHAHLRGRDLARLRAAGPVGDLPARQSEIYAADTEKAALGRAHPGLPDDLVSFRSGDFADTFLSRIEAIPTNSHPANIEETS